MRADHAFLLRLALGLGLVAFIATLVQRPEAGAEPAPTAVAVSMDHQNA